MAGRGLLLSLCLSGSLPLGAAAQDVLDVSQSCGLYRPGSDEQVYTFSADQQTLEVVGRIVNLAGVGTSVTVLAANVPSVLAVIRDDQRLVLYNTDFVYPAEPQPGHELVVLAMFAHAIAHHAKAHALPRQAVDADELEADHFTGSMLAQLSDDRDRALGRLRRGEVMIAAAAGPSGEERDRALLAGWRDADQVTTAAPGPEYEPPRAAAGSAGNAGIPRFPWPPPNSSARARVPLSIDAGDATLADVAEALETAFRAAGYGEFSYLAVPRGFALVSRLEQISADGTPLPAPDRWSTRVRPFTEFSLRNYLRALFQATPGHFRIVVFVVTPVPFGQASNGIEAQEAEAWLSWGLDALPQSIARLPVTDDTKTTALIYEFVKPTADDEVQVRNPSTLSAITHLRRARLWQSLGL